MKKLQHILLAIIIVAIASCGNTTNKTEDHVHGDGCSHSKSADTVVHDTEQESFTVEIDSCQSQNSDSLQKSSTKKKTHRHADGSEHSH